MTMKFTLALALSLSFVGCKKKEGTGGGGGGGISAFEPWVQKDAAKLWEGAWYTRMTGIQANKKSGGSMSLAGNAVAIEIKGDKATVFDGTSDIAMPFSLSSPCEARFSEAITEGSMKGGTAYHDMLFVVKAGELRVGSGAAGYRKGKAALVCSEGMDGGITVVDDKGGCKTWADKFGKLEEKPNTCVWSQKDGKDLLTIGTGDWSTKVYADGDILESEQFTGEVKNHVKAKDFADAKAQVSAKNKADDPGEQAKAAGGEVGKLDTAASLIASYAADKSLKGKPLEITLVIKQAGWQTANGKKTFRYELADKEDADFKLAISCELGETEPVDMKRGDKVIAKGTIGESFGKPSIEACTLAKAP